MPEARKVLIVTGGVPPRRGGGVPAYLADMTAGLPQRGFRVIRLDTSVEDDNDPRPRIAPDPAGAETFQFVNSGARVPFLSPPRGPSADVAARPAAARAWSGFLRELKPAVVHFHELLGLPLALIDICRELDLPTLYTAQDYYPLCPTIKLYREDDPCCLVPASRLVCDRCLRAEGWDRFSVRAARLRRPLPGGRPAVRSRVLAAVNGVQRFLADTTRSERRGYQRRRPLVAGHLGRIDHILCISRRQRELLATMLGSDHNLRVMYLGRRSYGVGRRPRTPGWREPGRVTFAALNVSSRIKGLDLLLAEFARLRAAAPHCELHLHGSSGRVVQDGVYHHGPYREQDLDAIAARHDAAIVPSIWEEAYGCVGPELLTRGLPVVASTRGAMHEYVRPEKNGLLFDPSVAGSLAAALGRLARDPDLLTILGRGALEPNPAIPSFEQHLDDTAALYAATGARGRPGLVSAGDAAAATAPLGGRHSFGQ